MKRKSTQKGCINTWNLNHPKCLDCGKLDKNRKRWSSGEKPELCYRPTVRLQDAARRACSALNLTLRWCVGDGKTEEAGGHSWTKKRAMGLGFNAAGNCNLHILLKLVASKQSLSCLAHHPYSYMFQAWNITFLKVGQHVINNYSFLGPTCEVFLEEYLCFVEYTKTLNGDSWCQRNNLNTWPTVCFLFDFFGGLVIKSPPGNAGDAGSIPGLGICPAEGNGNLLLYSYLACDRGAWQAIVHG